MSEHLPGDRALVDAFVTARTEAAFDALYARHAPRMYGLARRLMAHAPHEADDVLQTAWMRAAPRLAAFRGESSLSTWLCGFVVNCCRERTQRGSRGRVVTPSRVAAHDAALDASIDVHRALARLPPRYRAVLVLHDVEGHTHEEIGAMLGIAPGTSKSQLSRGRHVMRKLLAARAGET